MADGPVFRFDAVGQTEQIVSATEAQRLADEGVPLKVEVAAGRFRLAHSESEARRGDLMRTGEKAVLQPMGESVYAFCDALPATGDAKLLVRRRTFDLSFEPVNTFFSAGDTDGGDAPAASDGYDAISVQTQHSAEYFAGLYSDGRTTTTDTQYVELDVPRAAQSLTLMVDMTGNWLDSDEITMFVEWVDAPLRDSSDTVVTYRDDSDNPDYGCSGAEGSAYVSADVPVGVTGEARVGVDVQQLDGTVTDATSNFHAVIR